MILTGNQEDWWTTPCTLIHRLLWYGYR